MTRATRLRWTRLLQLLGLALLAGGAMFWLLEHRPRSFVAVAALVVVAAASFGVLVRFFVPEKLTPRARRAWTVGALAAGLLVAVLAIPERGESVVVPSVSSVEVESTRQMANGETVSSVFAGGFPEGLQERLRRGVELDDIEKLSEEFGGLMVKADANKSSASYQVALRNTGARTVYVTSIEAEITKNEPPVEGSLLYASPQGEGTPASFGLQLDSNDLSARQLDEEGKVEESRYLDQHYVTLDPDEIVTFNIVAAAPDRYYEFDLLLVTSDGQEIRVADGSQSFRASGFAARYKEVWTWGRSDRSDRLSKCEWPDGC